MALRIRHIATRFALILAAAAALPLMAYGVASVHSLQQGTRESVTAGNLNVATRAADEIGRYVTTNAELLKAVASDLQDTGLQAWQQDRILKNDVLGLREFREITLFDEHGVPVATSRAGKPRVSVPASTPPTTLSGVGMSAIHLDEDLLPTAVFSIRLTHLNQPDGWLVGEFSLEEMWKTVDAIRVPARGYALVVAPDGTLIAHGDPDKKALVAKARNLTGHNPLIGAGNMTSAEYPDEAGEPQLGVIAPISALKWNVLVEQPTSDAYATATALRRELIVAISGALGVMMIVGLFMGRKFIAPIFELRRGTQLVAEGKLDTRVDVKSVDEFGQLGDAFNAMAGRLGELQEEVKKQERQAMFVRIAAGLFHDLSHPIQNVGNSAKLLARDDMNAEDRHAFFQTIERELTTIKRFLDDLRNVAKPRPIERFPMDVNASLSEIVESMRAEAERHAVSLVASYAGTPLMMEGDRFALGRVYRNLITNAIQATPAGGRITVSTARANDHVAVNVTDTGSGIAADRLGRIFDDFVTTKKNGLGLGLAVSKRIVEQLDGTIDVTSEIGRGTSFTLRFPARDDRSAQAAAS
ncbi:MAG TPA: sensor histidine kinase [Vicinamibacterales bacterium]|jgi:signal transduction histidine kinase|nr:sensor histidine kinase [Vicinamibacterales bacterium]